MTTALRTATADVATGTTAPRPADVFVAFGITGDLAKVMTFRSLYRLERRGLLGCPIVGVAVDDWSVDDLREHAKTCIEAISGPVDPATFDRLAARLSYVPGDFADPETFERVRVAIDGARTPVFSTNSTRLPFAASVDMISWCPCQMNCQSIDEKQTMS